MVIKKVLVFTNIILYLVLIALWISIPDELTLNLSLSLFNLTLTTVLLISFKESLKKYYLSSQFKNFSSSFITLVLTFCILSMVNYLVFKNPSQWDFSADKENTLSKQTVQVVRSLESKLKVIVFSQRQQFAAFRGLLELYKVEKRDIEVQYVDIELEPALVSKYQVNKPNTIVFEYLDKEQRALPVEIKAPKRQEIPPGELQITNALVKISRKGKIRLYYTQGHGESSFDDNGGAGFSYFKKTLMDSSFDVLALNLLEEPVIPNDADVLMIWGPRDGFLKRELTAIDSYLKKGGNLLIGLDTNLNEDRIFELRGLLKSWGISLGNNLVIDQVRHVQGSSGSVPLVDKLNPKHAISKNISSPVFFPLVGSLEEIESSKKEGRLKFLAQSTAYPGSWAETTPKEFVSGKVTFHAGVDVKGPVGLAGIWKSEDGKTKIMAMANSTLVSNTYAKFSGNFNLLLNGLSWMSDEGRLISFDIPTLTNNPVFISRPQLGVIFYFSVVFAPLMLLGFSFFLYRRRVVL